MKIKGYEITAIRKKFAQVVIRGGITSRIWEKRKCFICKRHFKDGEFVTAVFTKRGKNLMACEECSKNLKENE